MTTTSPEVQLVSACGADLAPDAARWFSPPDEDDLFALDGLAAPVLDVGCGPGRIVGHLAASGVTALGIDVSGAAVARTRRLGAPVLHRSVFDPLPLTGRWGSAVLLDGNIGIGADPAALLRRLGELVRPGGRVLAEVAAPGIATRTVHARLTTDGEPTSWFPWAVVGVDGIGPATRDAGLRLLSVRRSGGRWFATIQRP